MATTLTTNLSVALSAILTKTATGTLSTPTDNLQLALTAANLANGTAANQADILLYKEVTINAASVNTTNLYSNTDSMGTATTASKLKVLLVALKTLTSGYSIQICGQSQTGEWTYLTGAIGNAITVTAGGMLLVTVPVDGLPVSSTVRTLSIYNASAGAVTVDIYAVLSS